MPTNPAASAGATPAVLATDKFHEMILYVACETEGDPSCGATKLNKILFYADFRAYQKLGGSISGQRYQKLPFGPRRGASFRPASASSGRVTARGPSATTTG